MEREPKHRGEQDRGERPAETDPEPGRARGAAADPDAIAQGSDPRREAAEARYTNGSEHSHACLLTARSNSRPLLLASELRANRRMRSTFFAIGTPVESSDAFDSDGYKCRRRATL